MNLRWLTSAMAVSAGMWCGLQCCIGFVVAPHLFAMAAQKSQAVPNTGVAAEIIGPLLHRMDLISMAAGAVLLVLLLVLRRLGETPLAARRWVSEIGFMATIVTAIANVQGIAPRIALAKQHLAEKYGAYHLADKTDPLYAQFGKWHGISTSLFLVGLVGSLVGAWCLTRFTRLGTTPDVR